MIGMSQFKVFVKELRSDDQMKYNVGIIPDRYGLQDYQERGFICVKNCQN